MNTTSINFESLVEWDNSPVILFSHKGKILYLNQAAEILFGYVSQKELFDIAVSYAPKYFGYKTNSLTLSYDAFVFHAITVGYENEEEISLRLYHMPRATSPRTIETDRLIDTDINLLLEANIALFKTKNNNTLTLLADHDLPSFKIDQNNFSKLLRKSLNAFKASDSIHISLKLLIGEHLFINHKKEAIAQLTIHANGRYTDSDIEIKALSEKSQIKCILKEYSIGLEIPLIQ